MICFFLKETSEKNNIRLWLKYVFNRLEINNNVIELPIKKKQKIKYKKIKKIVQRVKENNVRIAVLSNELEKQEQLKNEMYSNDIDILNGRILFKVLSKNIIEYICDKTKANIQNLEVSILVNNANKLNKSILLEMAETVKTLNIITNNINDFKDIETKLFEEEGITVNISNNKKKSLLKSNIIFNFDFCKEDINFYSIPRTCIFINTYGEVEMKSKKFNGINVKKYNIVIPERYRIIEFKNEIIYESLIYNLDYNQVKGKILEDQIRIKNLIGENGNIQEREFIKIISF